MSTPHRGLPPPASMALPSQPAPPPAHQPGLPPPPQQWQGAEDAMRHWLAAKAEEERTRQEEERTRQETLRLEQRRIEMDMLRASLSGGIPPPMIPLVFAGMSTAGILPQAALDWAQRFMQAQLPGPPRPPSPDRHRRSPMANPAPYGPYPPSPTRPRGHTVTGAPARLANPAQPAVASYQHVPAQQDTSPSIYFHHWQPPASQAGSSGPNRPGSPSGLSKTSKRKQASL